MKDRTLKKPKGKGLIPVKTLKAIIRKIKAERENVNTV